MYSKRVADTHYPSTLMKLTKTKYTAPAVALLAGAMIAGATSAFAASSTPDITMHTAGASRMAMSPHIGGMHHEKLTEAEKTARKTAMDTQVASILGIPLSDLQAKLVAGTSMKDIIVASGISEADFRTKMEAAHLTEMKAKFAADVTSGKLTQAQADQMITNVQNHTGKGFGHRGPGSATVTP